MPVSVASARTVERAHRPEATDVRHLRDGRRAEGIDCRPLGPAIVFNAAGEHRAADGERRAAGAGRRATPRAAPRQQRLDRRRTPTLRRAPSRARPPARLAPRESRRCQPRATLAGDAAASRCLDDRRRATRRLSRAARSGRRGEPVAAARCADARVARRPTRSTPRAVELRRRAELGDACDRGVEHGAAPAPRIVLGPRRARARRARCDARARAPAPRSTLAPRRRVRRAATPSLVRRRVLGCRGMAAWQTRSPSPAGRPSLDIVDVDGLRESAAARVRARPRRHDRLRHRDRLRAAARVDRRAARRRRRAGARHQRLDAGRRVPLRRARRRRRHASSSSARRTTARCSACKQRGADIRMVDARAGRHRRRRARARCSTRARARSSRTSSRTSRTPPATRCRATSASALLHLAARPRLHRSSRTTRTSHSASPARRCRRCSRSTSDDRVVYASSFSKTVCPGIRVGYLVGPGRAHRADRQARDEHVHLAEHGRAVDRLRVLRERPDPRRRSRRSRPRWPSASRRSPRRSSASCPTRSSPPPEGGYFMWVELPEGTDVDALFTAAAERGVAFVKGTDFLLEGGQQHAAPRVLRRDRRPDRRGRRAPRRGVPPAAASTSHGLASTRRGPPCSPGSRSASRWQPGSGRSPSSR